MHEESGGGSMPKVATSKPQTISYPAPGSRPRRNDDVAVDPHVVVLFGATGDLARRKLIPGPGLPGPVRVGAQHRDRRHLAGGHLHETTSSSWPRRPSTTSERTNSARSSGPASPRRSPTSRRARAPRRWPPPSRRPRTKLGPRRPSAALSVGAAEGRPRGDHHAARRESGGTVPRRDGEAVRHRSGQRRRTQRLRPRDVPTKPRSSASTTSSARRPRRTSWRSDSPTGCSNRSGTATSSTTSRSTSPRLSAWTNAPTSTRAPAPTRTWWSPTCSR